MSDYDCYCNGVFGNCKQLTEFHAPELRWIPAICFERCCSLKTISLQKVEKIDSFAFTSCALKVVTFPRLKRIESYAFKNYKSMQQFDAPVVESIC